MQTRFGLSHWVPAYAIEAMCDYARRGDLYAVLDGGEFVGTFIAATTGWKYTDAHWADPAQPALYLNKLAVLPVRQANGLGHWCLGQVEQIARERLCGAIRFDAITRHPVLVRFYTSHGYQRRGEITVSDALGRDWEVTLYEKLLEPSPPESKTAPVHERDS